MAGQTGHAPRSTELGDLDDGCLLNVLSFLTPLPDLFRMAAVSKRLCGLVSDPRMWLRVSHDTSPRPGFCRGVHATLRAAVQASRPGDTILVEPGASHEARDVAVRWPLRIVGGGDAAAETVLQCPRGADAALDFRASAKLIGVTLRASRGACVLHRSGRLAVEVCSLELNTAGGLDHLFAAIVTTAAGALAAPLQAPLQLRAEPVAPPQGAGPAATAGVLTVTETRIQGGSSAVKCWGSGALDGVRCIPIGSHMYFWFRVASGAHLAQLAPGLPKQDGHDGVLGCVDEVVGEVLSWQPTRLAVAADRISEADAESILDEKAKAWQVAHHSGPAFPSVETPVLPPRPPKRARVE